MDNKSEIDSASVSSSFKQLGAVANLMYMPSKILKTHKKTNIQKKQQIQINPNTGERSGV